MKHDNYYIITPLFFSYYKLSLRSSNGVNSDQENIHSLFSLFSFAMSSDVSWKTFDVKIAPVLSAWDDAEGTMLGVSLSIVKPITSYLGAGVIIEAGTNSSGCEECDSYDFNELSEGVLLNMNIPFGSTNLSLLSNFMFRSNLGIAWRTSSKRFGLELYPVDFAVTDYDVRVTFSLNAVFRAF